MSTVLIQNIHNLDLEGALAAADEVNNSEIIERLLACGADITSLPLRLQSRLRPMISSTWHGTVLHSACYENDLESLQALLASGKEDLDFDINMRNTQGWTALHAAVYLNRIEAVRLLINEGADVMLVTDEDRRHTALHIACSRGHKEIVVLLMNADDHKRGNKK